MFLPAYEHLLQCIALTTGLICIKKIKSTSLRLLIFLIALTCINENIIVQVLIKNQHRLTQDFAYNIFSLFDMAIWFYFFYDLSAKNKPIVIVLAVFTFLFSAIELFGYKNWQRLHIDSFRFYSLFIIYLSVQYLYQILKFNCYYNTFRDYNFFLCAAALIYQSILFITFSTLSEISFWQFKEADYVYNLLQVASNIFYYTFICVAFIVASRNKDYYKSAFLT